MVISILNHSNLRSCTDYTKCYQNKVLHYTYILLEFVVHPSNIATIECSFYVQNLSWCQNSGSFSSISRRLGCFESTPAYKASSFFTVEIPILLKFQAVSTAYFKVFLRVEFNSKFYKCFV